MFLCSRKGAQRRGAVGTSLDLSQRLFLLLATCPPTLSLSFPSSWGKFYLDLPLGIGKKQCCAWLHFSRLEYFPHPQAPYLPGSGLATLKALQRCPQDTLGGVSALTAFAAKFVKHLGLSFGLVYANVSIWKGKCFC